MDQKIENTYKPKIVYHVEDDEIKKIEVDKNIYLRILRTPDDLYFDLRKYYKGFPTKQGIKFKLSVYNKIKDLLQDIV